MIMARYHKANESALTDQEKEAVRYHRLYQNGRMDEMKYILLRDMQTFAVYMGRYNLEKLLYSFVGYRELSVFGYSICEAEGCPMSADHFAGRLRGEDGVPNLSELSEKEALLREFAIALSRDFHQVPEELYSRMEAVYKEEEMIRLIAFAGQIIASCVFEGAVMNGEESKESDPDRRRRTLKW